MRKKALPKFQRYRRNADTEVGRLKAKFAHLTATDKVAVSAIQRREAENRLTARRLFTTDGLLRSVSYCE